MERLTKRSKNSDMVWFNDAENGNAHLEPCEMTAHHNRMVLDKLATYEDLGYTPEECRAAMERQNPIAAIAEKEDTGTTKYICPTCGMYMGWSTGTFPARYCWKCGQKLDWSDEE